MESVKIYSDDFSSTDALRLSIVAGKNARSHDQDLADVLSNLELHVHKLRLSYDPERNVKFSTFFCKYVYYHLLRKGTERRNREQREVQLNFYHDGIEAKDYLNKIATRELVIEALSSLSDKSRQVINKMYFEDNIKTLKEASGDLGISISNCHRRHKKALKEMLRHIQYEEN